MQQGFLIQCMNVPIISAKVWSMCLLVHSVYVYEQPIALY